MKRPASPLIPLRVLTVLSCLGCATEEGEGPRAPVASEIRLVDASGAEVSLPAPARRIVSLVPSATETLLAMGAAGLIVGKTDYDTSPGLASVPSVGGGIEPNLEALVALRPDLVVRFAGEQDVRTPARLASLGIAHVAVRPDNIQDVYETASLLGALTGHERTADSLVTAIQEGLEHVAGSVRGLERLRVAYVLGGTPPWVAGPGTYIDELVSLVGGDNVFSDLGTLYAGVSPEELRTRDIEVVLLSADAVYDRSLTPSARIERVGSEVEIPGPGVVDAAHHLAELLHGRSEQ